MIACKDCEFSVGGHCHRAPPILLFAPLGRKWVFPLIEAFEGFRGCGEGRPAVVVLRMKEISLEEAKKIYPDPGDGKVISDEEQLEGMRRLSEKPTTMEAAVEKTREVGAKFAANSGKPIEAKPKRARRKK